MDARSSQPERSAVESHYDKQAVGENVNRGDYFKNRRSGPCTSTRILQTTSSVIDKTHAGRASSLVELGCGRGGDINKWRDANIRNVLGVDLSADQLDDARRRERQGGGKGKGGGQTLITWVQGSILDPTLEAQLKPKLPNPQGADAVAMMFAVQFAFGNRSDADGVLRTAAALLRPGGVFFGVAPDAASIRAAASPSGELRLAPPEHQFSLLLQLKKPSEAAVAAAGPQDDADDEFGQPLIFSLEDTVTNGTDETGCIEYLCSRETLTKLAEAHGLERIECENMARSQVDRPLAQPLTEAEAHVAGLYHICFSQKRAMGGYDGGASASASDRDYGGRGRGFGGGHGGRRRSFSRSRSPERRRRPARQCVAGYSPSASPAGGRSNLLIEHESRTLAAGHDRGLNELVSELLIRVPGVHLLAIVPDGYAEAAHAQGRRK